MKHITFTISALAIVLAAGCDYEPPSPCAENSPLGPKLSPEQYEEECGGTDEGEDTSVVTCRVPKLGSETQVCYEGDLSFLERQSIDVAVGTLRSWNVVKPWSEFSSCLHALVRYEAFINVEANAIGANARSAYLCWFGGGDPDFEAAGDTGPVGIGHSFANALPEGPTWNHAMPENWNDSAMLDPATYLPEEITVCSSVRCGLERWDCRCECESDADCPDFQDGDSNYEAFGICESGLCYWDDEVLQGAAPSGPLVYGIASWADGIIVDGDRVVMSAQFYLDLMRVLESSLGGAINGDMSFGWLGDLTHVGPDSLAAHLGFKVGDMLDADQRTLDALEGGDVVELTVTGVDGSERVLTVLIE